MPDIEPDRLFPPQVRPAADLLQAGDAPVDLQSPQHVFLAALGFLGQRRPNFSITRRTDIETTVLLLVIGVAITEIAV